MSNHLQYETSPYLLQHKENPVDWYPWCKEAFERAKQEDKPIFLSIGYSTCHWCHVMAHESFEDKEIADILNKNFISIKVDKEERPDIDSIYMSVCQAFSGNGGWPTSIFMTPTQKPFFAGTYFPKNSNLGIIGFRDLLITINEKWNTDRNALLNQSEKIIDYLNKQTVNRKTSDINLSDSAVAIFERIYDEKNGGFGPAPKFPTPHNLLFLLNYYERNQKTKCLEMAEHTLLQMYRGGMFDHIGFGFCRYSTDKYFLVPHFEKMLYDNALLILAYCKAYSLTKKTIYLEVAEKIADYIIREMTSPKGGFYSAQDADSEGEEGKYYLFTANEIIDILGEQDGNSFNTHFGISDFGNFEGKNIPNLLNSDWKDKSFDAFFKQLDDYRKKRYSLHLDDKILTFWNSLMIAAMCELHLISGKDIYINYAKNADSFIENNLCENNTLFVSFREGKRGVTGFLDDYAGYIFAQLSLYRVTLEGEYLKKAKNLCEKAIAEFSDNNSGFYLYGNNSEQLILRPKDTFDAAVPSGNSLMACNLVRLSLITADEKYEMLAKQQLDFITSEASQSSYGHSMFLTALLEYNEPPIKITIVMDGNTDKNKLLSIIPPEAITVIMEQPTNEYPLKNNKTTFYVCRNHSCMAPVNDLTELI